ncbi:hypothetical protein QBC39DRAFT_175863 [Podospora conica]|nr:hypothetical protein QBC39DRAFT_175863 [Schizothecium conicum]
MDIFGSRRLCSTTQSRAVDADILVWPRTLDRGACGPRTVVGVAGEVVVVVGSPPVSCPRSGDSAWAGMTGGHAQINTLGADFVQHQSRFLHPNFRLPASGFRRDTRHVVLGNHPSSHRSLIAPWDVDSFGVATSPPLTGPDRPRPPRWTLCSPANPSPWFGLLRESRESGVLDRWRNGSRAISTTIPRMLTSSSMVHRPPRRRLTNSQPRYLGYSTQFAHQVSLEFIPALAFGALDAEL